MACFRAWEVRLTLAFQCTYKVTEIQTTGCAFKKFEFYSHTVLLFSGHCAVLKMDVILRATSNWGFLFIAYCCCCELEQRIVAAATAYWKVFELRGRNHSKIASTVSGDKLVPTSHPSRLSNTYPRRVAPITCL
jgi:hypothetical protein